RLRASLLAGALGRVGTRLASATRLIGPAEGPQPRGWPVLHLLGTCTTFGDVPSRDAERVSCRTRARPACNRVLVSVGSVVGLACLNSLRAAIAFGSAGR